MVIVITTNLSRCDQFSHSLEIFQPNNKKEWAALSLSCATLLISSGAALAVGIGYVGYKWATAEKLGNPNAVETIYTPPRPTQVDLDNLSIYKTKIERLKQDPRVMGITFAANQEGKLIPIYIKHTISDQNQTNFTAHNLETDVQLGYAITHPFVQSNNYLKDFWILGRPEEYLGYGSNKEETSKILLQQVTNESNYKNIGVILNKAIHQIFAKQCEARMIIEAVRGTHPYHYKMGFRSMDSQQNGVYARFARNHQIPKNDLGKVYMHLPDQARQLWLQEIADHPIAFPS